MGRRRQTEDKPRPRPRLYRWVRVHRDPNTSYVHVYQRDTNEPILTVDGLDPDIDITARIAAALVGRVCQECGQPPGEGNGVCADCRSRAIHDLRGVLADD